MKLQYFLGYAGDPASPYKDPCANVDFVAIRLYARNTFDSSLPPITAAFGTPGISGFPGLDLRSAKVSKTAYMLVPKPVPAFDVTLEFWPSTGPNSLAHRQTKFEAHVGRHHYRSALACLTTRGSRFAVLGVYEDRKLSDILVVTSKNPINFKVMSLDVFEKKYGKVRKWQTTRWST